VTSPIAYPPSYFTKNCTVHSLPLHCQLWVWLSAEFLTKREWLKLFPISNDVIVVITYLQNCEIGQRLMNTDRPYVTVNEKSVHFFSLLLETLEWSGPKIWWAERWAGVKKNWLERSGAGSGSYRNRFEWRAEILPLPLHSHNLFCTYVSKWLFSVYLFTFVWLMVHCDKWCMWAFQKNESWIQTQISLKICQISDFQKIVG